MSKIPTTYSVTRRRRAADTLEHLGAQLAALQEEVVRVREELQPPPRRAITARGTGDVTEDARRASGQMPALQRPRTRQERDDANRQRHANRGDDRQRHAYQGPDDGVAPEELFELVEALIADRPCTLQELVEATGVRSNRISGALVHLDRQHPKRLMRFATPGTPGRRFRWFLAPASK